MDPRSELPYRSRLTLRRRAALVTALHLVWLLLAAAHAPSHASGDGGGDCAICRVADHAPGILAAAVSSASPPAGERVSVLHEAGTPRRVAIRPHPARGPPSRLPLF